MSPLKKLSAAAAGALKIFPLPTAVLFPGTAVPLHIFEPRYRDLVRDALASDRVMAIGLLEPGWERDYYGRPRLGSLCCAGVIARHEALPDGRFLVVVEGVARARIDLELPTRHRYREVRVQLLEDAEYSGREDEELREAVLLLASLLPAPVAQEFLHQAVLHKGGALADVVASSVVEDAGRRRQILEELDVRRRLSLVLADVSSVIARADAGRPHPMPN